MPMPPIEHITYGPVRSRRLGRSLGVNLLPRGVKVCTMNCAYCQYGWTRKTLRHASSGGGWPSVQAIEQAVDARLSRAADTRETIDRLTIAGHGEPTLHPHFEEAVERITAVRDRIAPSLPIAILSNSTTAARPEIQRGLAWCDERYMKLDAGDPFTFAGINGTKQSLIDLVDALRALPPIIVQAMFVDDEAGARGNTSEAAVNLWLAAVETVRAEGVHIYTIDRAPALASLRPVSGRRLREIAERVRRTGIPLQVFAGGLARAA